MHDQEITSHLELLDAYAPRFEITSSQLGVPVLFSSTTGTT